MGRQLGDGGTTWVHALNFLPAAMPRTYRLLLYSVT